MKLARNTQIGMILGAALCLAVSSVRADESDIHRLRHQGERFWLVGQQQSSCRVLNMVAGEQARVVESAIGQLNDYVAANYGVQLPVETSTSLPTQGDWIVAIAGAEPSGMLAMIEPMEDIGDQGFLLRQVAAPSGNGRWFIVWGKTPLGCRYGLIELMRSLQSHGNACFTELALVRDEPVFPRRVYYHNFGEHLLNAYSVNMLHDVPFARWTRADWRRFLEMLAAMRYTTYELWLSPTFFSAQSLSAGEGSKFDTYAKTIRTVIDDAHELGLEVEILICVNCTEPIWVNLCPNIPDEHDTILALWSHWTKQFSQADVFGIFPGDVGGCHRNGCTHETFLDLCLEIIQHTAANGGFRFEVCTWGSPFFDWGVPAREASSERAKAAFDCLLRRASEFPQDTIFSVNMHWDINRLFSGTPQDLLHSNRAVVEELRKRWPVMTWDYYLSESEEAAIPLYRVPDLLNARREERTWGYCGGINYTRTPRLNILTAFAAGEAYWNPDQTEGDILSNFSCFVFESPGVAAAVFPAVANVGQPDWRAFQASMGRASQVLQSVQAPTVCKLFASPSADAYRSSLLTYTTIYERLAGIALQVQEVVALSGRSDISAVKQWLVTAPASPSKSRVQEIVAGWSDFDLAAVTREFRSRVYGVYDLAEGADVRADVVNGHCQAFAAQFGITSFFSTDKSATE